MNLVFKFWIFFLMCWVSFETGEPLEDWPFYVIAAITGFMWFNGDFDEESTFDQAFNTLVKVGLVGGVIFLVLGFITGLGGSGGGSDDLWDNARRK